MRQSTDECIFFKYFIFHTYGISTRIPGFDVGDYNIIVNVHNGRFSSKLYKYDKARQLFTVCVWPRAIYFNT